MSSSSLPNRQPYDFTEVYMISRGAGKPIHTRQRLEEVRNQHAALLRDGYEVITNFFGTKTFFTLKEHEKTGYLLCVQNGKKAVLQLAVKDRVVLDTHSILDLANQDSITVGEKDEDLPHYQPLEYQKLMQMQRRCPFYLDIDWAIDDDKRSADLIRQSAKMWTKDWEQSRVHQDLLEAIQDNMQRIRQVDNVVCFGLGSILSEREYGRYYIQHLAVLDIARTLAQAQGTTVEVFAQDPQYTDSCKTILAELSPAITVVDFASAEGLSLVDENTFIVSLNATAIILEPAIQIAGTNGPAGMLIHPWLENAEEGWNGKSHAGDLLTPYFWGTVVEYEYRDKCDIVRLEDEKWLGIAESETMNGEVLEAVHAELLFAKK